MIGAPGCLASSRAATRPVSADGRHGLAALVDDEAPVGVAVEGQPDIGTRPRGPLPAGRRRFSGSIGFASWLGNVPSSSKYSGDDVAAAGWSSTAGAVCPAIPLPASTTTFSGRIAGQVDQLAEEVGVVGQQVAVG